MLHSADLGVAEGDYLKAAARLYEAKWRIACQGTVGKQVVSSRIPAPRGRDENGTSRSARSAESSGTAWRAAGRKSSGWIGELTIKADVPLRAPFNGRVIMRNITRGEVVETEQKLFTVADLSNVWVIGNVPEKDVQFIRKDQTVECGCVRLSPCDRSQDHHLYRGCA